MIYSFISPETAVILNVMPATVDFPTCEVSEGRLARDTATVWILHGCWMMLTKINALLSISSFFFCLLSLVCDDVEGG